MKGYRASRHFMMAKHLMPAAHLTPGPARAALPQASGVMCGLFKPFWSIFCHPLILTIMPRPDNLGSQLLQCCVCPWSRAATQASGGSRTRQADTGVTHEIKNFPEQQFAMQLEKERPSLTGIWQASKSFSQDFAMGNFPIRVQGNISRCKYSR